MICLLKLVFWKKLRLSWFSNWEKLYFLYIQSLNDLIMNGNLSFTESRDKSRFKDDTWNAVCRIGFDRFMQPPLIFLRTKSSKNKFIKKTIQVGLYDGSVAIFNLLKNTTKPIYRCASNVKHTDPVWAIKWQNNDTEGVFKVTYFIPQKTPVQIFPSSVLRVKISYSFSLGC